MVLLLLAVLVVPIWVAITTVEQTFRNHTDRNLGLSRLFLKDGARSSLPRSHPSDPGAGAA